MIRLALVLAVTMFAVEVPKCVAQDPKGYVAIGGLASITPTGELPVGSVSFPTIGLGGTAADVAVEAGRFVSRRLSMGFEASVPLRFDGERTEGYFGNAEQLESSHRDIVFSGLVREAVTVGAMSSVGLEIGGTVVFEDTVRRIARENATPPAPITYGPLGPPFNIRNGTLGLLIF